MFNPFDPAFAADPYAQYRQMRALAPAQRAPLGFVVLFGYDDVLSVMRDPRNSVDEWSVPDNPRVRSRVEILGERARRGTRSMLNVDPPHHTRLRRLVQMAFTARRVEQLSGRVQQLVDEVLAAAAARGGALDVITDLAFPLPFTVISEMLGMPPGDRDQLRSWSHTMTRALEPIASPADFEQSVIAASDHMEAYLDDVIAWKRDHLGDDLLSDLVAAEADGDVLSPEELRDQVSLLYLAGHETTVNLIGNSAYALLSNRAELERWSGHPDLDVNAVEELIRYDTPVQFSRRLTTTDMTVGGIAVEAGVLVLACLASANRDESHWGDDAEHLDLTRAGAPQHLSFGSGIHHCLGNVLARLESRIALSTIVHRFPRTEATIDAPAWNGRLVLRGLDSLAVVLRA
jgi:cytochrome P450